MLFYNATIYCPFMQDVPHVEIRNRDRATLTISQLRSGQNLTLSQSSRRKKGLSMLTRPFVHGARNRRQGDRDRRTSTNGRIDLDVALMRFDDPADDRKTKTSSLYFCAG